MAESDRVVTWSDLERGLIDPAQIAEFELLPSTIRLRLKDGTEFQWPNRGGVSLVGGRIREGLCVSDSVTQPSGESNQDRRAIPSSVRTEVWRRDGGKCVKCGSRENLEYDHIIPISKGGSNTARNIELLCENCNRTKSDSIQ